MFEGGKGGEPSLTAIAYISRIKKKRHVQKKKKKKKKKKKGRKKKGRLAQRGASGSLRDEVSGVSRSRHFDVSKFPAAGQIRARYRAYKKSSTYRDR